MSKKVRIGNTVIGGGEKIAIQSMSTFKISNVDRAIEQALALENAGCDILRFSVLDEQDAFSFKEIKKQVKIPLVADIHFDYRLAIKSIEGGADKIRINPGNIGGENNVKMVADALRANGVPVRVGSNTGSIDKEYLQKYGKNEISLAESALKNVRILEKHGVENIVVSVKASDVPLSIKAYEYVSQRTDYPLHLGITEAGTEYNGVIKNAMGIGALLVKGIGDTIRVSLSADPVREIVAGKAILSGWDCMEFAKKVEDYTANVKKPLKIAVMGCVVNGPGEESDADLGIAGAKDECAIFVKGKIVRKVKKAEVEKEFFGEIDKCIL